MVVIGYADEDGNETDDDGPFPPKPWMTALGFIGAEEVAAEAAAARAPGCDPPPAPVAVPASADNAKAAADEFGEKMRLRAAVVPAPTDG